ncbi:ADP-ribosylglycohydrolase family protein [Thermococcus sp.]
MMTTNLYDLEAELGNCRDNFCIMEILFEKGLLEIERSRLLYSSPNSLNEIRLDKVEGLLVGIAIGDALGVPIEGKIPVRGEVVKGYLPRAHITDDTQMAFWTLEVILKCNWLNPEVLADRYTKERIIGIGRTVKRFIKNYKDLKVPWYLAGVESAGNGALVKLPSVIIPHLLIPSRGLWSDAVVSTYLIYHDRLAISSAVAFTHLLWESFGMRYVPEAEWWLEEYVKVAREIEGDNSSYAPRLGEISYEGPGWYFIDKVLTTAVSRGWSLYDLNKAVGSGAYLLETIPMVLYDLMLYGESPFDAIVNAVSYSKDSDTMGAIVGYMIGALHGIKAFPRHLLEPMISGRILPGNFIELIIKTEEFLLERSGLSVDNVSVNTQDALLFRKRRRFMKFL